MLGQEMDQSASAIAAAAAVGGGVIISSTFLDLVGVVGSDEGNRDGLPTGFCLLAPSFIVLDLSFLLSALPPAPPPLPPNV